MHKAMLGLLFILCVTSADFAAAQNRAPPEVGVLWPVDASTGAPYQEAFQKGMHNLGWVDGENVRFIVRYGDNAPSCFPRSSRNSSPLMLMCSSLTFKLYLRRFAQRRQSRLFVETSMTPLQRVLPRA